MHKNTRQFDIDDEIKKLEEKLRDIKKNIYLATGERSNADLLASIALVNDCLTSVKIIKALVHV